MKLLRLLQTETIKLRRSLISLLIFGVPAMMLIMLTMMLVSDKSAGDWPRFAMTGSAIWAFFLLPMSATALTALLAQIEHGPGAWSSVLSLPYPKWLIYAAKAIVALGVMALISALLWVAIIVSGLMGGVIAPEQALTGPIAGGQLAGLLAKMWLAGILVLAIQFAIAMAIRNFAAPVVVGIGGTFVAVVATSAKIGIYFPWLLPTNILASDPTKALQALLSGAILGMLILVVSCVWLGCRDEL
jgi:ABC-2 type transport system permease protein